jgi:hypothetical protein
MPLQQDDAAVSAGTPADDDRRKFLATCGKFAIVTPPAITMLLSTSLNSTAIATSGAHGYDYGNGGSHGQGNNGSGGSHGRGEGNGGDESSNGGEDSDSGNIVFPIRKPKYSSTL